MSSPDPITVTVTVQASPERAWKLFTDPASVTEWNFASPEWHCPSARSDLRDGGEFSYRMEARDGSFGFDFEGKFVEIAPPTRLRYSLGEDRVVLVEFEGRGGVTIVSQSFTPETTHPIEQQRAGWQAILDNYRQHVETSGGAD